MDIKLHTTTAYAVFDLSTVTDSRKLYILLINEYSKGTVINVIKNNNAVHAIFKTTEDFTKFMNTHYSVTEISVVKE